METPFERFCAHLYRFHSPTAERIWESSLSHWSREVQHARQFDIGWILAILSYFSHLLNQESTRRVEAQD